MRRRGWLMAAGGLLGTVLVAAAAVCFTSGCSTLGFYAQAAGGHLDLLRRARPVAEVMAANDTPATLKQRIELSQRLRDFASAELALPDNNSYRRYADLERDAVVWNVVATPALSLTLKTWCFPVMGCVGYRGYFQRAEADALAAQLRAEGLEVNVYGVPAYSTLGWSNWVGGDPLLNTFIQWSEPDLARLIFHELAHQVAYADDDTTFNESFAVAVERIGGRRWMAQHVSTEVRARDALNEQRREEFRAFARRWRAQLETMYRGPGSDADKLQRKTELMAAMRRDYETMKKDAWNGWGGYDHWVANANNASFGVMAAYNELVPQFERLYEHERGDLPRFYARVKALAALPRNERRAKLAASSSQP